MRSSLERRRRHALLTLRTLADAADQNTTERGFITALQPVLELHGCILIDTSVGCLLAANEALSGTNIHGSRAIMRLVCLRWLCSHAPPVSKRIRADRQPYLRRAQPIPDERHWMQAGRQKKENQDNAETCDRLHCRQAFSIASAPHGSP